MTHPWPLDSSLLPDKQLGGMWECSKPPLNLGWPSAASDSYIYIPFGCHWWSRLHRGQSSNGPCHPGRFRTVVMKSGKKRINFSIYIMMIWNTRPGHNDSPGGPSRNESKAQDWHGNNKSERKVMTCISWQANPNQRCLLLYALQPPFISILNKDWYFGLMTLKIKIECAFANGTEGIYISHYWPNRVMKSKL